MTHTQAIVHILSFFLKIFFSKASKQKTPDHFFKLHVTGLENVFFFKIIKDGLDNISYLHHSLHSG